MHAQLEDAAALREEEHRSVRMRSQEVQRVVFLARTARRVAPGGWLRSFEPDATSFLSAEHAERLALDIAAVSQRDHDLFFWNRGLRPKLARLLDGDLPPALAPAPLFPVLP